MKRFALYFGIAAALVASCSIQEENFETPQQEDVIFYAYFEQPSEGTRVYANEELLLRWTADDRVSIFNKLTYNQQYKFTGETGDNAGGFRKIDTDEFVTGNTISHVVSVYPYQEGTKITESEVLSLTLPAEQHYAENTFGLGANTMVSVSEDNVLQYKNVGGYLRISLYGEGVSVSSITLKGNNGEKLAGKVSVTMPLGGMPTVEMSEEASEMITLTCDTPVTLRATAEESTDFWFVFPPVTFSKGFTITVTLANGGVFEKSTTKSIIIERSKLSKMSPIEVELSHPKNVIYYTSSDGSVITPTSPDVFGAGILSNEYVDGLGIITFDGDVTSIGKQAFVDRSSLISISIPSSVTSIGEWAFNGCTSLSSIIIPEGVSNIDYGAFLLCKSLTSVSLPSSVKSFGLAVFSGCQSLTEITLPNGVTTIGDNVFEDCSSLTSITIPDSVTSIGEGVFNGCLSMGSFRGKYASPDGLFLINEGVLIAIAYASFEQGSIIIPESVTSIGKKAFRNCSSLTNVTVPNSITRIGRSAFSNCSNLTSAIIQNGVEVIDMGAFSNCSSLSSLILPYSVTSIGSNAFGGCSSLTSITALPSTPPAGGARMFSDTNDCPIFVPAECVEAYRSAQYWSDYADRIQPLAPLPEAVDLGLPSGLKWASFNLGASKLYEYGDYYAWGETEPYYCGIDDAGNMEWKESKENGYSWSSYMWSMDSDNTLTKYCSDSSYGNEGFIDGKTALDAGDDAAFMALKGKWRMPTYAEWDELREQCSWEWTLTNDTEGFNVIGPNGNRIFLPATGYFIGLSYKSGSYGGYWSSSLDTDRPNQAWYFHINSSSGYLNHNKRYMGRSIRPVCD